MEGQINPFRSSFENSKERRLHLLHTGHLSDCEFLVGEEETINNDGNEERDSDAVDVNGNSNEELRNVIAEVTPNPTNDDSTNGIEINLENCRITGPKLFRCHKMILASTSEVFERMFYGRFDDQPNPIRITDIHPDVFELFINYIYTYDMNQDIVNMQNIGELLYIAEKYMLKDFGKLCVEIIKKKTWLLTDILPMFENACLYDNVELSSFCEEKICANAEQLLKEDTFYQLNINYLGRLMIILTENNSVKLIQMLTALERYGRINKLCEERQAEGFVKLVNAACELNYGEMNAQEYASGPGVSYLFANKYDDVILL